MLESAAVTVLELYIGSIFTIKKALNQVGDGGGGEFEFYPVLTPRRKFQTTPPQQGLI
jgi:hypothetical protein